MTERWLAETLQLEDKQTIFVVLIIIIRSNFLQVSLKTSASTWSSFIRSVTLNPPFSSLSSFSARILHLRSYLSCACSCSIFISRLMVSVLIPGLATFSSSNSMVSCWKMSGINRFHHVWGQTVKWGISYLVGERWEAGLLGQPELLLRWVAAKRRIWAYLYHLDWWSCCCPRVSLWGHGDEKYLHTVDIWSFSLQEWLFCSGCGETLNETFSVARRFSLVYFKLIHARLKWKVSCHRIPTPSLLNPSYQPAAASSRSRAATRPAPVPITGRSPPLQGETLTTLNEHKDGAVNGNTA